MRVLGIDPGTRAGWALLDNGERIASGTWDLSKGALPRFVALRQALQDTLELGRPDLVAFESVLSHGKAGVLAGHVYGGIIAVIELVCYDHRLQTVGVNVSTVKRQATGKGGGPGTDKAAMVAAAQARWAFDFPPSADEADALWVAAAAEN